MRYPTEPPELSYAYAVSVEGLRPWEFDACPADAYHLITAVRAAFESELRDARAALSEAPE